MYLLDESVRQVISRADLGPAVKFFIEATAEHLDPSAHFSRSANSIITTHDALVELNEAIDLFKSQPSMTFGALVDAITRTREIASRDKYFQQWYPTERQQRLDQLQDALTAVSRQNNRQAKINELNSRVDVLKNSNEQVIQLMCDPVLGYESKLVKTIVGLLRGSTFNNSFTRLDKALHMLMACGRSKGRSSGPTLTNLTQSVLKAKTNDQAIDYIETELGKSKVPFEVAIVFDGAGHVKRAMDAGFQRITPKAPIDWRNTSNKLKTDRSQQELVRFCAEHWGVSDPEFPMKDHDQTNRSVYLITVDAWDIESARHKALIKAGHMVDRLNARHRRQTFGVKRKVLVWEVGSQDATYVTGRHPSTKRAEPLNISASPYITGSLSFYSRALAERAGVLKVFFSWIAMENMGSGVIGEKAQDIVVENVPATVALTNIRAAIYYAWEIYSRTLGLSEDSIVRQFVGAKAPTFLIDADKWLHLLTASKKHPNGINITIIEEHLINVSQLSSFSRHRYESIRNIVISGATLRRFADEVHDMCTWNLQRMRLMRNQTAHTANLHHAAEHQLSSVAVLILDSIYEVVPGWPQATPGESLKDVSLRLTALKRNWERAERSRAMAISSLQSILS